MPFDYENALKQMPHAPGIYIMRDVRGTIFYVGKAKDLNKRLRQYFTGNDERAFVYLLDEILDKIDIILTGTEQEALILEAGYIKKFRPRYNILLKDDKEMLQLRIDLREEWPRVEVVRKRKKDGAHYFGPYPSAVTCRRSLNVLNRYFVLRTCKDTFFKNRVRPCLQYEIRRCMAPCTIAVEREVYLQRCREAMLFLAGKFGDLLALLQSKMEEASQRMAYELAASYRDQIAAIRSIGEEQRVVQRERVNQDYVAVYVEAETLVLVVMMVREGRLMHMEHYTTHLKHDTMLEVSLQILVHHYQRFMNYPRELIVEEALMSESELLHETLKTLGGVQVAVLCPKRGGRLNLLKTAQANAVQQYIETQHSSLGDVLGKLEKSLSLSRYPHRIECYDISNLQAGAIVASMTVFMEGVLDASRCRTFKLREGMGQNDFLSLYEVITRRLRYLDRSLEDTQGAEQEISAMGQVESELLDKEEERYSSFSESPDLMLIDGGKGQLGVAMEAVKNQRLEGAFDIRAIAKARVEDEEEGKDLSHSPERIFFPHEDLSLILPQDSPELLLLVRVRDETHRRAIGFHRKRRDTQVMRGALDAIAGVGPKRKALLLKMYGSVKQIGMQSVESLVQDAGLPRGVAERIHEALGNE